MEHVTNAAVVDLASNIVINKIVADATTDIAPDGMRLIDIPDGTMCDPGWLWNGTAFVPPVVEGI
jgi:hypothetical protein